MKKTLAANAGWSLASHVMTRGSLMLTAIILARNLNTVDFTRYSYFQLTISMISAYAAMGLGVTASRYFAEIGKKDSIGPDFPLGTLWLMSLFMAVFVAMAIALAPHQWFGAGLEIPQFVLALGVAAVTLQVVPTGAILGLEKYKYAAATAGGTAILTLSFAYWAAKTKSPELAMYAIIAVAIFQVLGDSIVVFRVVGLKVLHDRSPMAWAAVKQVVAFASPLVAVTLMSASGAWIVGRFILRNSIPEEFAMYSIGLQWFSFVLLIPGILSRVFLPRIVRFSGGQAADKRRFILSGVIIALLVSTVFAVIVSIFSSYIVKIYGEQYSGRHWVVIGFCFSAVIASPANMIGNAIIANGGQKEWAFVSAIWLLFVIVISASTSGLGAIAGAFSLAGAAAIQTGMAFYFSRRKNII